MYNSSSVNAVIDDKVYIGNLSAALTLDHRNDLGISHVLSVCPENPSTGPNHLNIPVQDSEYEDLLIRLPEACQFIQFALDEGGKILVHCVMGVSRSTTVVCAYLMWTRHWTATAAMRFVKCRRPQVNPNYGFMKQLQAFAHCEYTPSSTNKAYLAWKRKQQTDVTNFLNKIEDTVAIIPDRLFLSSDFPNDPQQAEALLREMGITHLLSLSPAQISSAVLSSVEHHHINVPSSSRDALLLALPDACNFIDKALNVGGPVLVHCLVESRASTVVCSYLMSSRNMPLSEAFTTLEDALPLFNPTRNFSRHLELFEACKYAPTSDHPLVKAWVAELNTGCSSASSAAALNAAASRYLDDVGFDVSGFAEALNQIQKRGIMGQG